MKPLLMATLLLIPVAAKAMCYTVYDASDKMIYRSATSPVALKGSLREAVQQRFPGSAMTITNDYSCPSYDRPAAEAQERANSAEAKRRVAERGEATRVTAEQVERQRTASQATAARGSRHRADSSQKPDRGDLAQAERDDQTRKLEKEERRAEECRKSGYMGPACAPAPAPAPRGPLNCMPNGIGGLHCF